LRGAAAIGFGDSAAGFSSRDGGVREMTRGASAATERGGAATIFRTTGGGIDATSAGTCAGGSMNTGIARRRGAPAVSEAPIGSADTMAVASVACSATLSQKPPADRAPLRDSLRDSMDRIDICRTELRVVTRTCGQRAPLAPPISNCSAAVTHYVRRSRKNSTISPRQSSSRTPDTTSNRWLRPGSSAARIADTMAPDFGSAAP